MKLIFEDFHEISNFPFVGEDNYNRIVEAEKLDEFEEYIDEHFPEGITAHDLCEWILWNDETMNEIFNELGITTDNNEEEGENDND